MAVRVLGVGTTCIAVLVALARGTTAAVQDERSVARLSLGDGQPSTERTTFEGFVLALDGAPAEGAVVVSSAGGRAVTDAAGSYRLEVEVPPGATHVQVTAVGVAGGSASAAVALGAASPRLRVAPLALARGSSCSPSWLPRFGTWPGTDGRIHALAVFDDGGGPALFVGGGFRSAGGVQAVAIAKWDGASWSALGSGNAFDADSDDSVSALVVFDDGGGPALYVAGDFSHAGGVPVDGIARWDGTTWSALAGQVDDSAGPLAVFDDGSGPALYLGGDFEDGNGDTECWIKKWDGAGWSPSGGGGGPGTTGSAVAMTVHDDGSGAALYVGGTFTGTVPYLAKWDGSSWTSLGSGVSGPVYALASHDDGGGPALYAGGSFTSAGGVSANRVAKWDGASWSALGGGMDGAVLVLASLDDGGGPALLAGGTFATAGGASAKRVARWDGSAWSEVGGGVLDSPGFPSAVRALAVFDDGGGPRLHAGGNFWFPASNLTRLEGASWAQLGDGISSTVQALAVHDDGGGEALFAGGYFSSAGGVQTSRIARWDGASWSPLGSGVTGSNSPSGGPSVQAFAVFDDGGGPALHAGGLFTSAGGSSANRVARWDGSGWSALGSGVNGDVLALAVHDDGGGPALYAAGSFTSAGGGTANRVARWNGASWSALGAGVGTATHNAVRALAAFDDGGGPALYAAGSFTSAGGAAASRIARWNGASWSALGSGLNDSVHALAVFDDGGGPALYAGGWFTTAGGNAASHIAKWDGASWSALGSGTNTAVRTLTVFDEGGGPALFAGGYFTTAGGGAVRSIARWNGATWSALGGGMSDGVFSMAVYDDGSGPALFAGGEFGRALDSGDSFLAKWGCDSVPPVLACPDSVNAIDRGSPGEVVHFTVSASDAGDPSPSVVCVPPSGSFFPRGTTLVTCTATDASGNPSSCQFPVIVEPRVRPRQR